MPPAAHSPLDLGASGATACDIANHGVIDEGPQRREEQPDENLLRWTGRSQQEEFPATDSGEASAGLTVLQRSGRARNLASASNQRSAIFRSPDSFG
jgi:hypothetical protein